MSPPCTAFPEHVGAVLSLSPQGHVAGGVSPTCPASLLFGVPRLCLCVRLCLGAWSDPGTGHVLSKYHTGEREPASEADCLRSQSP